jgi:hypothetical protein
MKAYLFAAALAILLSTSCAMIQKAAPSAAPVDVASTPVDVFIDQTSGLINPAGLIRKRPGDVVHIQIQNTNTDCFSYNVATAPTPSVSTFDLSEHAMTQSRDFGVRYDGDPITISIAAYPTGISGCPTLPDRMPGKSPGPWEIKVANDGWDLAFAGAFTADNLTDPKFTIEETTAAKAAVDGPPAQPAQPAKYTVFKGKGDSVRLGSAAMVHLYHTEPDPLGRGGVNWVPFSFGLGVGDSAHVRYYLGTGIRFDKKLFLSAGAVLGSQATLNRSPNDMPTTDANFLTSHAGSRTAAKFFFSVSYSFIGVGPDAFKGSFTTVTPQPSNPPVSGGGGGDATDDPNISVTATTQAADTYTLVVENTGADAMGAALVHNFPSGVTAKWTVTATGNAVCGELPTEPESSLTRTIDLPKSGKCEYVVKTTGGAAVSDPDKLPTTILVDGAKIFDSNEP